MLLLAIIFAKKCIDHLDYDLRSVALQQNFSVKISVRFQSITFVQQID